ncbi:MAG: hypothetical protein RL213_1262 [Bacteroidota bacterium]|jgi:O-antigen ligase
MVFRRLVRFFPAAAVLLLLPFVRWEQLPDPDLLPRHLVFASVVAVSLLLTALSRDYSTGRGLTVSWPGLAVICFMSWALIRTNGEAPAIAEWLRWLTGAVVVVHLSKCFREFPVMLRWLPACAALFVLLLIGSLVLQLTGSSAGSRSVTYDTGGWAGNKNFLAETLAAALFLLLPGWKAERKSSRLFIRFAAFTTILTLLALKSVTVWLVLPAVAIFSMLRYSDEFLPGKSFRRLLLLTLTGGMVLVALSPPVRQRVEKVCGYLNKPFNLSKADPENDNSVYDRLLAARNSLLVVREHPVLGCGLTHWKTEQAKFGMGGTKHLNTGLVKAEHPHSEYLLVLAELGLVGLLFFLAAFALFFWGYEGAGSSVWWSRMAVLMMLLVSLFSYPLSRDLSWFVFLIHVSVVASSACRTNTFHFSTGAGKAMAATGVLSVIAAVFVSGSMLQSEYHLGQSMAATLEKQPGRAKREALKAESRWYVSDRTGTPVAWYIGDAAFRAGDRGEAVKQLERARQSSPYHPRVLNDLGTAYEQTGNADSAIACYKAALRVCPGLDETKLNLAAVYFNSGRAAEAADALNSIVEPDSLKGRNRKNYLQFRQVIEASLADKPHEGDD